jgi:hypothetical protein
VTIADAVAELRSPATIRQRAGRILEAGLRGELAHFEVDLSRLPEVARLTSEVTRRRYPTLAIPPHSRVTHFDGGDVPRFAALERELAAREPLERARTWADIVVTSVLLDAGAGPEWRYREASSGACLGRSEGLAVASLAWVASGGLSSRAQPYEVDAVGLLAVDETQLARAFQVSADNPLVGVEGRVRLMHALGLALQTRTDAFGARPRLGNLVDALWLALGDADALEAERILGFVLDAFGSVWPSRYALGDVRLGDVWRHPRAGGAGMTEGFMPFHKLCQWLSYSLLYPLEVSGLPVRKLDALTGLAEYRNGGLFLDGEVLHPKHAAVTRDAHDVGSELVVEWRALTLALLDRLAPLVRHELGRPELALVAILEGGTWAAGRELAQRLRADASPPLRIVSDGTVF